MSAIQASPRTAGAVLRNWDTAEASSKRGFMAPATVFLATWCIGALLQFASGAFQSEFIGYPDEPAHVVTALMAHDYLTSSFPGSPVGFAKNFYVHYPEVAIGHWPPVLYMLAAAWTLFFSASPASFLLLMSALSACISTALYVVCRHEFTRSVSIAVSLAFPLLFLVQQFSGMFMAEIPLALFCFLASFALVRLFETQRWQYGALFGIFGSLATLTKGSGWLLLPVAFLSVALTRHVRQLLRPAFWLGPIIIVATCLPWQIITLQLAKEGWNGPQPGLQTVSMAIMQLCSLLISQTTGFAIFALAIVGTFFRLILPLKEKKVTPFWAVMGSLIVCTILFHAIVPSGVEARKAIIAAPPLLLFVAAGAVAMAGRLAHLRWMPGTTAQVVTATCVIAVAAVTFQIPHKSYRGYDEIASRIAADASLRDSVILISTQSHEGPFVQELAMAEHRPGHIVLRGSKVLAKSDWNGSEYSALYPATHEMREYLRAIPVDLLVLDSSPGKWNFQHHQTLLQMLNEFPEDFRLVQTVNRLHNNLPEGHISLYRRQTAEPDRRTVIDMARIQREVLSR